MIQWDGMGWNGTRSDEREGGREKKEAVHREEPGYKPLCLRTRGRTGREMEVPLQLFMGYLSQSFTFAYLTRGRAKRDEVLR